MELDKSKAKIREMLKEEYRKGKKEKDEKEKAKKPRK